MVYNIEIMKSYGKYIGYICFQNNVIFAGMTRLFWNVLFFKMLVISMFFLITIISLFDEGKDKIMAIIASEPVVDTFVAKEIGVRRRSLAFDSGGYYSATEESVEEDWKIMEIMEQMKKNGVIIRTD